DRLSLEDTVVAVNQLIASGRPHQHCVVNAGKLVLMQRDYELKRIVTGCNLINADGQSVVWALKLLGQPVPARVTGIDLMERLFVEAHHRAYRIFFLGAQQDVLTRVLAYVRANYPRAIIAGAYHGYFSESEEAELIETINQSNADILFVAMGSPKKE